MGNSSSSESKQETNININTNDELKPKSISQIVDYIASKYIFTMNKNPFK